MSGSANRFFSLRTAAGGVVLRLLLVIHGTEDSLIAPELGKRLFDAATGRKAFVLIPGGSHHNTNSLGQEQYRAAMAELFGLR